MSADGSLALEYGAAAHNKVRKALIFGEQHIIACVTKT
jgi:hypothetical protein